VSAAARAATRVFVGRLEQIAQDEVLTIRLAPDEHGRPREALVLLDGQRIARAYLNQCRHLPIPLDAASRDFLRDGQLQCATHGARYRIEDGVCVAGPCRGSALLALPLIVQGTDLYVVDDQRS
jgi:nitrite reductase/ring-hydroxylating ferredoxin subunit